MDDTTPIAHVRQNEDGSWAPPQILDDHLDGTARLASQFAASFHSASWAYAAGLAHDTGKANPAWQQYLKRKSGYYDEEAHLETKPDKPPHSTPGAKLVEEVFGKDIGRILSYGIAGHHAGLPDLIGSQSSLLFRLQHVDTSFIPLKYRDALLSARPATKSTLSVYNISQPILSHHQRGSMVSQNLLQNKNIQSLQYQTTIINYFVISKNEVW